VSGNTLAAPAGAVVYGNVAEVKTARTAAIEGLHNGNPFFITQY
jgi:hypothetical protein